VLISKYSGNAKSQSQSRFRITAVHLIETNHGEAIGNFVKFIHEGE
jgi:hypothetical protein